MALDMWVLRVWGVPKASDHTASYDPPRATAAQSGGAWAAPNDRTAAGESDPNLDIIQGGFTMLGTGAVFAAVRLTSQVTYKLGRRCIAIVWLAFTICADVP